MPRMTKMPAKCNLCGHEEKSMLFPGDSFGAIVAVKPCRVCGGSMYRNDPDYDGEDDIGRSARDLGD